MILEGGPYGCYDDFGVKVRPGNMTIRSPGTYGVTMTDVNGNKCWGTIVAEDKLPPVIDCRDITIKCGEGYTRRPSTRALKIQQ